MEFASNERELLIQIRKAMRYEDADKEFPSENWATDVLHKFKTRIRAMLTTPVKDYEVEARYGKYKEGCFYPGLSCSIFENVNGRLAQLCSNENGQPEHTRTLIEGSGIRKITDLTHADKKPIYQRKIKASKQSVNIPALGVRISIAHEKEATEKDFKRRSPTSQKECRERVRTSYILSSPPWKGVRIDCTKVKRKSPPFEERYEIEIERRGVLSLSAFIGAVAELHRWVTEAETTVPPELRAKVTQLFNRQLFRLPPHRALPHLFTGFVNSPVSLKYSHLYETDSTKWAATVKLDGTRQFLFVTAFGTFLCLPFADKLRLVGKGSSQLDGTLIDGECIGTFPAEAFHAFDLLFCKWKDVREQPFFERFGLLQIPTLATDLRLLLSAEFGFYVKTFFQSPCFYSNASNALADSTRYTQKKMSTDGLIFQPVCLPYRNALTLKWKPRSLLSIDFYFLPCTKAPDSFELMVGGPRGQVTRFSGSSTFPYNGTRVTVSDKKFAHAIVECAFKFQEPQGFVPVRVRPDKHRPNNSRTASSVWNDINDPISQETIEGHSLKVFRKLSNQVKRELLNQFLTPGDTILDVGSGRGGDLTKWLRLKQVFAVEPNPTHREEFHRRLKTLRAPSGNGLPLVTIIPGNIENTSEIAALTRGSKINSMVAFFCLTFLARDEASWSGFLHSVNRFVPVHGKLIGTVLDGALTRKMLDTLSSLVNSTIRIDPIRLHEQPQCLGDQVEVHISDPDAIVKHQKEYLFYFERFRRDLEALGFVLIHSELFSERRMHHSLPPDSRAYSRLNRAFVFARKSLTCPPPPTVASNPSSRACAEEKVTTSPQSSAWNCSLCERNYSRKGDLTKHRKRVHGTQSSPRENKRSSTVKNFACPQCDKRYTRRSDLTKHDQKIHARSTGIQTATTVSVARYRYALTFVFQTSPLSFGQLRELAARIDLPGTSVELIDISAPLRNPPTFEAWISALRARHKKKSPFKAPDASSLPEAGVLIIRNGVTVLSSKKKPSAQLYEEQMSQVRNYDGIYFDKGKTLVKRAFKTMQFGSEARTASPDYSQATVTAFDAVPVLQKMGNLLQRLLGFDASSFSARSNRYHTDRLEPADDGGKMKCVSGMGWHGDERTDLPSQSACLCLGEPGILSFVWRFPGHTKNCPTSIVSFDVNDGDIYILSDKATGFDWRSRSLLRVVHSLQLK